jgi:hypothetical protein
MTSQVRPSSSFLGNCVALLIVPRLLEADEDELGALGLSHRLQLVVAQTGEDVSGELEVVGHLGVGAEPSRLVVDQPEAVAADAIDAVDLPADQPAGDVELEPLLGRERLVLVVRLQLEVAPDDVGEVALEIVRHGARTGKASERHLARAACIIESKSLGSVPSSASSSNEWTRLPYAMW